MQQYSDLKLLLLARNGDKEAFGELMKRYQPMALRLAIQMVDSHENAYELVQEAMLQAYLSLANLRDMQQFKSWFYGIVLNICRSFLRSHKQTMGSLDAFLITMPEEELIGTQPDPQEEIEERELQALLQQGIQQLSSRNQSVTRLYYYEQLSVREIAVLLQISVVAVKSRLLQARKELHKYLLCNDPELASQQKIPQRRRRIMRTVTIADIVQQEHYSVAILMEQRRVLPFLIGYNEGQAILSLKQSVTTNAPPTFTFITELLQATHSEVREVRLERLKDETLYAVTTLRQDTETQEIEGSPGDALALATYTSSPIYVADDVMEQLGLALPAGEGQLTTEELKITLQYLRSKQVLSSTRTLANRGYTYQTPREPRNLDFSDGTSSWIMGGKDAQNYLYDLDQSVKRSSVGSLTIRSKLPQSGQFTALIQMISAENYRNKRVRFSALLKTEEVTPRTMLCFYAYGNATVLRQQFNDNGPLTGTVDWQRCSATLEIPADCIRLGFGTILSGSGQVWMNEVTFTIIEQANSQETETVITTEPYNLDFSQGTNGWNLWQNAYSYEYGLDTNTKVSGDASLYLCAKVEQPEGQVALYQGVSAKPYRGKRLRIRALIKAQEVALWGGLWVRVNGDGGGMIFNSNVQQDSQHDLGIIGSQDWQEYQVTLDMPDQGARIEYGLGLMGKGNLWLDHLTFEIVGSEVPLTIK